MKLKVLEVYSMHLNIIFTNVRRNFLLNVGGVHTTIWNHQMDADKAKTEKAWLQLLKNATSYIEKILEAIASKTAAVRPPSSHL